MLISSKFCKSSYCRPLCWSPVCKGWYGKSNKMFHTFLFSSYHITKLQPHYQITCTLTYNRVTRISPHQLGENCKFFHKVNQKLKLFLLVFSSPSCTKGNQEMLPHHAYRVVQPFYTDHKISHLTLLLSWKASL